MSFGDEVDNDQSHSTHSADAVLKRFHSSHDSTFKDSTSSTFKLSSDVAPELQDVFINNSSQQHRAVGSSSSSSSSNKAHASKEDKKVVMLGNDASTAEEFGSKMAQQMLEVVVCLTLLCPCVYVCE